MNLWISSVTACRRFFRETQNQRQRRGETRRQIPTQPTQSAIRHACHHPDLSRVSRSVGDRTVAINETHSRADRLESPSREDSKPIATIRMLDFLFRGLSSGWRAALRRDSKRERAEPRRAPLTSLLSLLSCLSSRYQKGRSLQPTTSRSVASYSKPSQSKIFLSQESKM